MKNLIKITTMTLFASSLFLACGEAPQEEVVEEDPSAIELPDARGISLTGLGKSSGELSLTEERDCSSADDLGVFGIAIGAACHLAPIASDMLYGKEAFEAEDKEKALSCASYQPGKDDQGILKALLCDEGVRNHKNISSIRFSEEGKDVAISFEDFDANDSTEAVGTWTARGPESGRYPANIRLWNEGVDSDELHGLVAMNLSSGAAGSLYFDFNHMNMDLSGGVDFVGAASTENCKSKPSKENCHFEDISIKGSEVAKNDTPVPGLRLRILANDKDQATFIALEGKYRLNEDTAAVWFKDLPEALLDVREIYFRTIQQGTQIWGSFDFKNEAGETVDVTHTEGSVTINLTKTMRNGLADVDYAGVCHNFGSDEIVDCVDIDYKKYDSLWVGDAATVAPAADYQVPVSFEGVPGQNGVVTK